MDEFKFPNGLNQDILKNIKMPSMSELLKNQSLPQYNIAPTPTFKLPSQYGEGEDCKNIEFCSKLDLTVDEICTANGEFKKERCSFGDTRIIKLISSLGREESDIEHK